MEIEFDPAKARENHRKHGIRLSDAAGVLHDPHGLTVEEVTHGETEQRFVTVGMDALGRVLTVVYTYRDDKVRLISARKATPRERQSHEEGI